MRPIAERSRERVVSNVTSSERRNSEEQLLVGELTHRMNNELAAAITVVSLAAARSTHGEVKNALAAVAERLHREFMKNRRAEMRLRFRAPSADLLRDERCVKTRSPCHDQ